MIIDPSQCFLSDKRTFLILSNPILIFERCKYPGYFTFPLKAAEESERASKVNRQKRECIVEWQHLLLKELGFMGSKREN